MILTVQLITVLYKFKKACVVEPSLYEHQRDMLKCLYDLGVCIKQAVGINITDTIIVTWTKARNFKATEPCLMS